MTGPDPSAPQAPPDAAARASAPLTSELWHAVFVAMALAAIGALVGLLWALWSPPGPRALIVAPGVTQPDETEAFIAGDGRFLAITAAIGLLAALAVWFRRPARGVATAAALAVGGAAGAALTALVGHVTGGGSDDGRVGTVVAQLPLSVHAQGLYVVEPTLAVLVFGLLVAFAAHDDLGRPDPVRDRIWVARPAPSGDSVDPGAYAQHGGGNGDAAGVLEQGDLAPQQPGEPHQPR